MDSAGREQIAVLHVDDEPDVSELAAIYLERECEAIDVSTESSPTAALETLDSETFDCVVSDYDMPEMDGLAFLDAVRERYPDLPFVLFTGKGSEEIASEAISAGVTDYLQKQVGPDQYAMLANRVRNAVEHHRTESALRESEEKYRTVVERSHDAIYIYRGERFLFVNDRACEISGYDEAELYEMNIWDLLHEDDHARVRRIAERRSRDADAPSTYEARVVRKSGDVRHCEFSVQTITHDGERAVLGSVRDLTERRRTERRFRALVDQSTDILTVLNGDGTIRYRNAAVEDVLGYDQEELLGHDAFQYIHPDDREAVRAGFERCLCNPDYEAEATYRWRHDDGSWRTLESRARNHLDDHAIEGLVINSRDVTERREARAALEAERNLTESALDALDNIFFVLSPDGKFIRWSDKLKETTGYAGSEIDERCAATFFREEDGERVEAFVEEVVETGRGRVEVDVVPKEGEPIPHEAHGVRLTDEEGDLVGVCGIATDVTERERRERDLAFFKQAVERVGIGVGIYGESGRFEYVNGHYADLLATTREELLGTCVWEVATEYDEDDFPSFWASFDLGESQSCETRYERYDGTTVPGEGVTTRTEIHGEAYNIETVRDITERKSRERELQRQNDYLQEFASIVSHDLKNPLNVAEGRMKLAEETGDAEHFEAAGRAHDRMGQIIDDLLLLARQGQAVDSPEPVDLVAVCEAAWTTTDTGENAALSVDDDLGTVEGDPERLRQMFENLFANAVEHSSTSSQPSADDAVEHSSTSPQAQSADAVDHSSTSNRASPDDAVDHGSTSTQTESRERIDTNADGELVHCDPAVTVRVGGLEDGFYVGDDGPGIPAEQREAVFERGYSTDREGTGFGLSIVAEIVDAHGWRVRVTESAAGGARFEVDTGEGR